MTKDLNLEAVNGALGREVRKLQEELKAADKANATITARVKELEEALKAARPFIGWAGHYPTILAQVDAALTPQQGGE